MAKKNDTQTGDLYKKDIPKMPEGYYSGDKPNPNLRAFVEEHLKERPYDPESDDYSVPAFNKPIETTKATAIYSMHTYWSKKPHDAIRQYIRHYTKPGDLVLDPFCGSGGTALAALMEDRKAIAIDRSPAATFITKNYCTPVDVDELQKAFEEFKRKVKPEIDWLYETKCDRCGGKATTAFTVYSQVFQCSRCLEKVPLFDCVEVDGETAKGKSKKITACPNCHKRGIVEEISTRAVKFGAIPVLVSYFCEGGCRPTRGERRYNDSNKKKREYFARYDLGKIQEIEAKEIPYWYPKDRMMNVESNTAPWGDEWRPGRDFRTVAELFTKRNLWALAAILEVATHIQKPYDDVFRSTVSSFLLNLSKLYKHREGGGGQPTGNYYIPQINRENEAWTAFERKYRDTYEAHSQLPTVLRCSKIIVSTDTAIYLNNIPSNSVDTIFTDPPYAGKYQYGELNFIWESWLRLDTHWHNDEITINVTRGKTEADWTNLMQKAMAECFRVLKPGRWLSLCYHDTSEGTWSLVQDIMAEVGFLPDSGSDALYIDTGQKTYNQSQAEKVTKRDLVINFRKPKPGEVTTAIAITGNEDNTTFNEKVRQIICDYLGTNPGSTKDRIYDEVVSRMVRSGQMEAHDFEELLSQVAEEIRQPVRKNLFENESPDLFGSHEIGHWYLKETESGAEQADQGLADDVAQLVQQFISRQTTEELKKSQTFFDQLTGRITDLEASLEKIGEDDPEKKKSKLRRELREVQQQWEKLSLQRSEWEQQALHYTYISEFYFPLTPKPRMTLVELLEDYFYMTEEGNWRPPLTDEERIEKQRLRNLAARRKLQRFCRLLMTGDAIPSDLQPNVQTLIEWLRYCKRSGLYEQGKLLYEKGGLNLDNLTEEVMVNVEEDYQVCVRMLARVTDKTTSQQKKNK